MDNATRLYEQLRIYIGNEAQSIDKIESIFNKFQGIFDLKEVAEYKNAMQAEPYTPTQFAHLTSTMKRSFVEGYLFAQMEQSRKDIRTMYNMYKQEAVCPQKKEPMKNDAKTS